MTSQTGSTAITTTKVQVHPASAPGLIGVSINAGAQFTNRPEVDLVVRWPIFVDYIIASNDGGFSSASTTPISSHVPWTLDSSGPERLPKTVYLRFDQSTQTFQDDIILDQTPPEITEAGEDDHNTGGDRAGLPRYARASSAVKSSIKLTAADNASGVRKVQFAVDRSAPSTPVAYSTRLAVPGSPRWVRVQDGAGNWSAWRAIARPDLTIPAQRLRQLVRGLTVKVTCRQACVVKARLTVARGDARRLHLRGTTLATGKATGLKAGAVRVRIRPKSKVARRIGRLRKLRVTVTGTIATAKGISPVAKSVTLRR